MEKEKGFPSKNFDKDTIRQLASQENARMILKNVILVKVLIEGGPDLMSLVFEGKVKDYVTLVFLTAQMSRLGTGLEHLNSIIENISATPSFRNINQEIYEDVVNACSDIWKAIESEELDFSGYFKDASDYDDIVGYMLDEKKTKDDFFFNEGGFDAFKESFDSKS